MTEMVLPLSVDNIRKLERALKNLTKEIRSGGKLAAAVEIEVANALAKDVSRRVSEVPRSGPIGVDGNVEGVEPPNVIVQTAMDGTEVLWLGDQIAFVEFGTGARGAAGFYPYPVAMGEANYHPDPTKRSWWYPYNGYAIKSYGIPPYAPMASAALMMDTQNPAKLPGVRRLVSEALARAISL